MNTIVYPHAQIVAKLTVGTHYKVSQELLLNFGSELKKLCDHSTSQPREYLNNYREGLIQIFFFVLELSAFTSTSLHVLLLKAK